jgi:hypothetical protein
MDAKPRSWQMTDTVITKLPMKRFFRKAKFAIFVPKGITKVPTSEKAVISDLFLLRNDLNWKTEFELLNVRGLIEGNNKVQPGDEATIWFFDEDGIKVGEKQIVIPDVGRFTIKFAEFVDAKFRSAKTFAVFHTKVPSVEVLERSYLAERGYTGYEYLGVGLKGYVHGNLDAAALADNKLEMLGNAGLLRRRYTVQHELTGPAEYEFFFTNPTPKAQKIVGYTRAVNGKFTKFGKLKLKSRGSGKFQVKVPAGETSRFQIKSRLYLGRPVVFRVADQTMDVFHG